MKDETPKLSAKQESVIVALLANPSLAHAAKACGISETTIWRFQQDQAFVAEYALRRRQSMEQAIGLLQTVCSRATITLCTIMQDSDANDSARVSACRAVLEYAFRGSELLDTNDRLAALEAVLKG